MQTRVQLWGNSLAMRIPKSFAIEVGLVDNALVDIRLVDGQLIVKPIIQPEFTLEQLLTEVTEDNLHGEINTGLAMGSNFSFKEI